MKKIIFKKPISMSASTEQHRLREDFIHVALLTSSDHSFSLCYRVKPVLSAAARLDILVRHNIPNFRGKVRDVMMLRVPSLFTFLFKLDLPVSVLSDTGMRSSIQWCST